MILDTFYSVIRADTRPLQEGMDESKKSTDEVIESLRDAQAEADRTSKGLSQVALGALAWLTTLVSVGATARSSLERIDEANLLGQTSRSIGSAVENVDAFRRSVMDLGGSGEAAVSSLTNVFQAMGQAAIDVTGTQARAFQVMGVELRNADGSARSATDALLDVAGALEGVDQAQARVMLGEIGVSDPRVIELILQGRDAIESATAAHIENGVVTGEMAENAARLARALATLRSSFDRIKMAFDFFLLPALETGVEWLQILVDWVGRNQRTVTVFFGAVAGIVLAMYVPAMVAAAAATLAATWPIIAIGAAIAAAAAAFALIYDDIQAFIAGNDSMIGSIFSQYPMVETVVMGVVDAFRSMYEILSTIVGIATDFFKFAWGKQFELIGRGLDKVRGLFGFGGADVQVAQESIINASASPLNPVTSNAISNSASNVNEANLTVGEITIQTQATDAGGIARDTRSELQEQLENMAYEFSSGVAR